MCNFGFVQSIINNSGTLSMSCTCPTGWTAAAGTGGNACCPANSTIVSASNTCACNSSATPAYY